MILLVTSLHAMHNQFPFRVLTICCANDLPSRGVIKYNTVLGLGHFCKFVLVTWCRNLHNTWIWGFPTRVALWERAREMWGYIYFRFCNNGFITRISAVRWCMCIHWHKTLLNSKRNVFTVITQCYVIFLQNSVKTINLFIIIAPRIVNNVHINVNHYQSQPITETY